MSVKVQINILTMKIVIAGHLYEEVEDFDALMEYNLKVFDKNSSNKVRIHPAIIKYVDSIVNKITEYSTKEDPKLMPYYQELVGYVVKLNDKGFDLAGLRHSGKFMDLLKNIPTIKHAFWNNRSLRMQFRDLVG
jgi:hypothetical protein